MALWVHLMPVSSLPMVMPWPVKPIAHTWGAFTLCTPHSTVCGLLLAEEYVTGELEILTGSSMPLTGRSDSSSLTSERAAIASTRERSPLTAKELGSQNDWNETPFLASHCCRSA